MKEKPILIVPNLVKHDVHETRCVVGRRCGLGIAASNHEVKAHYVVQYSSSLQHFERSMSHVASSMWPHGPELWNTVLRILHCEELSNKWSRINLGSTSFSYVKLYCSLWRETLLMFTPLIFVGTKLSAAIFWAPEKLVSDNLALLKNATRWKFSDIDSRSWTL